MTLKQKLKEKNLHQTQLLVTLTTAGHVNLRVLTPVTNVTRKKMVIRTKQPNTTQWMDANPTTKLDKY